MRVRIGDGTTIGAGSVVTRDIPSRVVAAGNPCRVLRINDEVSTTQQAHWPILIRNHLAGLERIDGMASTPNRRTEPSADALSRNSSSVLPALVSGVSAT
jgi:hypothetical protein